MTAWQRGHGTEGLEHVPRTRVDTMCYLSRQRHSKEEGHCANAFPPLPRLHAPPNAAPSTCSPRRWALLSSLDS